MMSFESNLFRLRSVEEKRFDLYAFNLEIWNIIYL